VTKNLGRDDLSRLGLFRKEWESRDWVHRGNTANDRESGQRVGWNTFWGCVGFFEGARLYATDGGLEIHP